MLERCENGVRTVLERCSAVNSWLQKVYDVEISRQFQEIECIEAIRCNFESPASERLGRRKTELLKSDMEHFRTGKLRQTSPEVRFLSHVDRNPILFDVRTRVGTRVGTLVLFNQELAR